MSFEKAYDARPKPLNLSIPLDGMYLYFFEAGQKSRDIEVKILKDQVKLANRFAGRPKGDSADSDLCPHTND